LVATEQRPSGHRPGEEVVPWVACRFEYDHDDPIPTEILLRYSDAARHARWEMTTQMTRPGDFRVEAVRRIDR
jgi:hypothetical protein